MRAWHQHFIGKKFRTFLRKDYAKIEDALDKKIEITISTSHTYTGEAPQKPC